MANAIPVTGPQPSELYSATETYSKNILGPVFFELSNLRVGGTSTEPAAPSQSPYIIGSDEQFSISVDVKFNNSPLTELLMCLGTEINVNFAFEGVGKAAAEADLEAPVKVTSKGQFEYTVTYTGTPSTSELTPGFYAIAAVVTIGPANNPCSQKVLGYGYIAKVLLQVY